MRKKLPKFKLKFANGKLKSLFSLFNFPFSLQKGFTLIELLLVMALLAILATTIAVLVNPVGQFQKARDAQRKNDLAQLQRSLEQYYNDYKRYPASSGNPDFYILNNAWGNNWSPYMDVIPKDPLASSVYRYIVTDPNGQFYLLYANLERGGADPQACNASGLKCSNVPSGIFCGSGTQACNYGVTSPNYSP